MRVVSVIRKPFEGSATQNIVTNECGGLNIDATRIGGDQSGRWPANLMLAHTPLCTFEGHVKQKGYTINRWTDGAKPFGGGAGHDYAGQQQNDLNVESWKCHLTCPVFHMNSQSGGASRYFKQVRSK